MMRHAYDETAKRFLLDATDPLAYRAVQGLAGMLMGDGRSEESVELMLAADKMEEVAEETVPADVVDHREMTGVLVRLDDAEERADRLSEIIWKMLDPDEVEAGGWPDEAEGMRKARAGG